MRSRRLPTTAFRAPADLQPTTGLASSFVYGNIRALRSSQSLDPGHGDCRAQHGTDRFDKFGAAGTNYASADAASDRQYSFSNAAGVEVGRTRAKARDNVNRGRR